MTKVHIINGEHETLVCVRCPGCGYDHGFRTRSDDKKRPTWTWNGSHDAPSFKPSMLVNQHHPSSRCHSFVTDGQIKFLGDCHHGLKHQTVDLPELDEDGDPVQ